jgi:formate dehydrogenase subunit beta
MLVDALHDHARKLLEGGQVDCVIGYEDSPRGKTRPTFVRSVDQVERLVWNDRCTHNLVGYLKSHLAHSENPVAVVVKPCDSKAINVLLGEHAFAREQVHVIGIACEGMLEESHGDGCLQSRCQVCELSEPVVVDEFIGIPVERKPVRELVEDGTIAVWLEQATSEERMDYWLRQFDRCIRCYACRQACPMCSCPTCLFERDDSLWIGSRAGTQEKRTFHLGRAYHLAGRCAGCNECERVCPMDIPISLLNQFLAKVIETQFQFRAGFEPVPSPMTTVLGGED